MLPSTRNTPRECSAFGESRYADCRGQSVSLTLSLGEGGGDETQPAKMDDMPKREPPFVPRSRPRRENRSLRILPSRVFRVPFGHMISLDPPLGSMITPGLLLESAFRRTTLFTLSIRKKRLFLPVKLHADGIMVENVRDSQIRVGVVSQPETPLGSQSAVQNVLGRSLAMLLVRDKRDGGGTESSLRIAWGTSRSISQQKLPGRSGDKRFGLGNLRWGINSSPPRRRSIFFVTLPLIRLDDPAEGDKIPLGNPLHSAIVLADENGEAIDSVEFDLDKNGTVNRMTTRSPVAPLGAVSLRQTFRFDASGKPSRGRLANRWTQGRKNLHVSVGPEFGSCSSHLRPNPSFAMVERFDDGGDYRTQTDRRDEAAIGSIVGVAMIGISRGRAPWSRSWAWGRLPLTREWTIPLRKSAPWEIHLLSRRSWEPIDREGQAMVEVVAGKEANVERRSAHQADSSDPGSPEISGDFSDPRMEQARRWCHSDVTRRVRVDGVS